MRKLFTMAALAALVFTTGCIESVTMIEVEKDGSGRVLVREYYSPQITQMLEGMSGMMAQMATASEEKPAAPASIFAEAIESKTESMGPGVKLVSSKELSNEAGWKGFNAVYSFEDINTLRVAVGDTDFGASQMGMMGETQEEEEDSADMESYAFRFTPGSTAMLQIIPPPVADIEDMEEEGIDADDPMADMGVEMMAGMMKPMLKGMRMSLLVKVKGEITETNAKYPSQRKDMITIMDLPMDEVLNNDKALAILMEGKEDPQAVYKLNKLGLESVKLEEAGKTLSLSFK